LKTNFSLSLSLSLFFVQLKRVKILRENQIAEDVTQKVEFNVKQSVDVRTYEGFLIFDFNYYL
jgi:hypothetical protein